jgi:hypothetical protein
MRPAIIAALLLLFSARLQALEFPIEIIESIDNSRVVAFVNETDIDQDINWSPFTGEPPLTVAGALTAIQRQIATDPGLSGAALTEIGLRQIPHHETHWHYLVKLQTRADDKLLAHYFIVLMDGKVIRGLREPQAVK